MSLVWLRKDLHQLFTVVVNLDNPRNVEGWQETHFDNAGIFYHSGKTVIWSCLGAAAEHVFESRKTARQFIREITANGIQELPF